MKLDNELLDGLMQQLLQNGLKINQEAENVITHRQIPEEIAELNKSYAVTTYGNKAVVLWEHTDHKGNHEVAYLSVTDFRAQLSNRFITLDNPNGSAKKVPLAKYWLEHEQRRSYDGVVFDPSNTVPDHYYNLYRGLAIDAIEGDWSLIRQHIFEVICDSDEKIFEYLMAWMARIVQDPGGKRPGTLIAIRGGQGCGKGIIIQMFGLFFGSHYQYINNQQQLTGKFNSHLQNTLFLNVDEGFFAGSKSDEGTLKGLVTEDVLTIEPKGRDAFRADNHVNITITSNYEWVVPAGEDERRYVVLTASNHRQGDHGYFTALANQIDNGGREAFLYALLNWDFTSINLRKIPQTDGLLKQKIHNFSPVQRFWFDSLISGHATCRDALGQLRPLHIFGEAVASQHLYDSYMHFCNQQRVGRPKGKSQFIDELKSFRPLLTQCRVPSAKSNSRQRGYRYPDLEACRAAMSDKLSCQIDWQQWTDLDSRQPDTDPAIQLEGAPPNDDEFSF